MGVIIFSKLTNQQRIGAIIALLAILTLWIYAIVRLPQQDYIEDDTSVAEAAPDVAEIDHFIAINTEYSRFYAGTVAAENEVEYHAMDIAKYETTDTTKQLATNEELGHLFRIVWAEARGEDNYGQMLVVHVIMNRVKDYRFPSCITGVITQTVPNVQFSPIIDGSFDRATPSDELKNNVLAALYMHANGVDLARGALFFRTITGADGSWHQNNLQQVLERGTHRFYR